jgi:hypothetical protein
LNYYQILSENALSESIYSAFSRIRSVR